MKTSMNRIIKAETLVIGSGAAGLTAALELAPQPVLLLNKTEGLISGSSRWAQGGVAAALDRQDSPALHAQDTMRAGAGLNRAEMVRYLTEEGPECMYRLLEYGMPFDKDARGRLDPQKEAAHSRRRVLHAHGDATGRAMVEVLAHAVEASNHIEVHDRTFAFDLVMEQGRVKGVIAWREDEGWVFYQAGRVVLASGGAGQAFKVTTNPAESTGDGLAMALRAGAKCADLEFVQFHPTALAVGKSINGSVSLITEAVRGEGAKLLNNRGDHFMNGIHPDAELAPRDVVARAVWSEMQDRGPIYLDARAVVGKAFPERFPTVFQLCMDVGIDPRNQPIPVTPAVHYYMGGVLTDEHGNTSIPGLWACGEVAATGVHGANRLASNSLLECLVFARRVARSLKSEESQQITAGLPHVEWPDPGDLTVAEARERLQEIMYTRGGLIRSGNGMREGIRLLSCLEPGRGGVRARGEWMNLQTVGLAVLVSALLREESRGAHFREDFPITTEQFAHRQILVWRDIQRIARQPATAKMA